MGIKRQIKVKHLLQLLGLQMVQCEVGKEVVK